MKIGLTMKRFREIDTVVGSVNRLRCHKAEEHYCQNTLELLKIFITALSKTELDI